MKLQHDSVHAFTLRYNTQQINVPNHDPGTHGPPHIGPETTCILPLASCYSVQVGDLLRQMLVVVYLPVIIGEATLPPVQAMDENTISEAENLINMKLGNILKVFQDWFCQMWKAHPPRIEGYKTARVYTVRVDDASWYTPTNVPAPHPPTGYTYYQLQPTFRQSLE